MTKLSSFTAKSHASRSEATCTMHNTEATHSTQSVGVQLLLLHPTTTTVPIYRGSAPIY